MDESTRFKLLPAVTIRQKKDRFEIKKFENNYTLKPDNSDTFHKLIKFLKEGAKKSELEDELNEDLDGILGWFERKRLVAEPGKVETQDDRIIASQSGYSNLNHVKDLIKNSNVGLIGIDSINGLFNEVKIKQSEIVEADIDILVAFEDNLSSLESINKKALDADIPMLFAWPQNNKLHLGPFVIPETTACGKCLMSRINYDPQQVTSVGCEIFEAEAFKPLIKQDLYRFLGKYQYPRTTDAVLEIDLTTFEIKEHSVFKVPNCEHCGEKKILRE